MRFYSGVRNERNIGSRGRGIHLSFHRSERWQDLLSCIHTNRMVLLPLVLGFVTIHILGARCNGMAIRNDDFLGPNAQLRHSAIPRAMRMSRILGPPSAGLHAITTGTCRLDKGMHKEPLYAAELLILNL